MAKAKHEITFALIPSDDFGEIIDTGPAKVAGTWLITDDGTWNVPTTIVRLRRTRAVWTALTLLTALTVLTADIVDEVDRIGVCGQQRQRCKTALSMTSTMSIRSAVNAVNLVNAVNAVTKAPPSGGVARASHEITFDLIPSDDFGEIIDTVWQ